MGFLERIFGTETVPRPPVVLAPLAGKVIPLEDIPDQAFNQEPLGPGCGLEAEGEMVRAPFAGTVTRVILTGHGLGLVSRDGVELFLRVGMDTVKMKEHEFQCLVQEEEQVRTGRPLLRLSLKEIRAAGHPATATVILANREELPPMELAAQGRVKAGELLLQAAPTKNE